jgi:hypothetical protein
MVKQFQAAPNTIGDMAKKKPTGKTPRYPSRDRVKYVPIPIELWAKLDVLGKPDERSVSYMTRKAIRKLIAELEGTDHDAD